MKKPILYIIALAFVFSCTTSKNKQPKILIFCAASLTNVVSEISEEFENKYQVDVQLNFASSGTLARQIEHGANPELFISANKKWVKYLNEIEKTTPEYEKEIAGNLLVVIAPVKSKMDTFQFVQGFNFSEVFNGRLSIGDPLHVPAGEYAMQAMESLDFEKELQTRLLRAKDVRSALLLVELGETELGIVYKTDALKSDKVKIVAEIPTDLHSPITYLVSKLKDQINENTKLFYEFLNSETSKGIWKKNGFKIEM